jgi:hypothetical protein
MKINKKFSLVNVDVVVVVVATDFLNHHVQFTLIAIQLKIFV